MGDADGFINGGLARGARTRRVGTQIDELMSHTYDVGLDPWCGAERQANAERHGKPGDIDKGKRLGQK